MAATVADVMVATLRASACRGCTGSGDSLTASPTRCAATLDRLAACAAPEAAGFAATAEGADRKAAVCAGAAGRATATCHGLFDANRSGRPGAGHAAQIPPRRSAGVFQEPSGRAVPDARLLRAGQHPLAAARSADRDALGRWPGRLPLLAPRPTRALDRMTAHYRAPGRLGKMGRTGQRLAAAPAIRSRPPSRNWPPRTQSSP